MVGGPAATAGVKAGDRIVGINGKAWTSVPLATVRAELKAAPGRKVRLKMDGGPERVVTTRDLI